MSQQINLFLPQLQPRRDWLAFPLVAGLALLLLLLLLAGAAVLRQQANQRSAEEAVAQAQLATAQQQLSQSTQTLTGRKPDPAVQIEIEATAAALRLREDALQLIESGAAGRSDGYVGLLRGFSQQAMAGVWLTGFSFNGRETEIRGRLADPALLPGYIRRLNSEPVFQGQRFGQLELQREQIKPDAAAQPLPANAPRYTDFVLRAVPVSGEKLKP